MTLSSHVDHYHGFSRSCNVDGCDVVASSTREFAEHYARHGDPTFRLPDDFEGRKKAVLPCPR